MERVDLLKLQFRRRGPQNSEYSEYELVTGPTGRPDLCCDEMLQAYREGVIRFGAEVMTLRKDCDFAIWYWRCYPEGAAVDRVPINYCPFCAAAIQLEELT
jgi:hypothetical protein